MLIAWYHDDDVPLGQKLSIHLLEKDEMPSFIEKCTGKTISTHKMKKIVKEIIERVSSVGDCDDFWNVKINVSTMGNYQLFHSCFGDSIRSLEFSTLDFAKKCILESIEKENSNNIEKIPKDQFPYIRYYVLVKWLNKKRFTLILEGIATELYKELK